jgi:hypothetical protein
VNKASFTALTADATGKIAVSITNAQTYNYLNGFILTEADNKAGVPQTATKTSAGAIEIQSGHVLFSNELYVYPKPGGVTLSFQLQKAGNVSIELFNAEGKRMYSNRARFNNGRSFHHIHVNGVPPGVYYLKVNMDNMMQTRKIFLTGR